jgi:hypothetical protein
LEGLSPPVKTETTGTTNGKTRGDKHNIKRLEQQELLMVKLEVIIPPIKRVKQQEDHL